MISNMASKKSNNNGSAPLAEADRDILRNGALVQRNSSTVSAIEYLKHRGIDGETIQRVLAGPYFYRDKASSTCSW